MKNKIALITGINGIQGYYHAKALNKSNYYVIVTDVQDKPNQNLIGFEYHKLDVKNEKNWKKVVKQILAKYKKIDLLVNNAAFTNNTNVQGFEKDFLNTTRQNFQNIIDVNLFGTFLGCQIIGEQMIKQGYGSIINISSIYGVVSPNHTLYNDTEVSQPIGYSVSKHSVIALTKYIATYLIKYNVRVNCISPGGIEDDQNNNFKKRYSSLNPQGRMAKRDEISESIVFLASENASHIVGHNLIIDGGWTLW